MLKCVTTCNVFTYFHVCITSNHHNDYIVAQLLIGSKADIEVYAYIINGYTFEHRTVKSYALKIVGQLWSEQAKFFSWVDFSEKQKIKNLFTYLSQHSPNIDTFMKVASSQQIHMGECFALNSWNLNTTIWW